MSILSRSYPTAILPPDLLLEPLLRQWLQEDIGRGDRTTQGLLNGTLQHRGEWVAKQSGVVAGLPVAAQVFHVLDTAIEFTPLLSEGATVDQGQSLVHLSGPMAGLLSGERVALNVVMHLSGIATATRQYVEAIADLPTQLVDTRKTTPGLRLLEKYATQVGGSGEPSLGAR